LDRSNRYCGLPDGPRYNSAPLSSPSSKGSYATLVSLCPFFMSLLPLFFLQGVKSIKCVPFPWSLELHLSAFSNQEAPSLVLPPVHCLSFQASLRNYSKRASSLVSSSPFAVRAFFFFHSPSLMSDTLPTTSRNSSNLIFSFRAPGLLFRVSRSRALDRPRRCLLIPFPLSP